MHHIELIASSCNRLKNPKEYILKLIPEQCRSELLEFFDGKKEELPPNCRGEVAKAAWLYAAEVYTALRLANAVAKSYKLAYELLGKS